MWNFLDSILIDMVNCWVLYTFITCWVLRTVIFISLLIIIESLSRWPFFKIYLLTHLHFTKGRFLFYFFIFGTLSSLFIELLLLVFGVEAIETLRKESTKTTHSWLGSNQFANMNLFTLLNCANVFQSYVWTRITLLIIKCFFLAVDLYSQIYFVFFLTDQFLMSTFLIDFL